VRVGKKEVHLSAATKEQSRRIEDLTSGLGLALFTSDQMLE
jgi:hypothetical protein